VRALALVVAMAAPAFACPDGMVPVAAGRFAMGSADEPPVHDVALSAFCIDRTEVTVQAYAACVATKKCTPAVVTTSPLCSRDPDHPVTCVDWYQAAAYCAASGNRLPSEAEWEYAARGSDGRRYPWGNEPPSAKRLDACGRECVAFAKRTLGRDWVAMYDGDDGWPTTAPVGSYPAGASPFGVLDMAGNVWEWTADWRGDYPMNPRGPATAVVNPHGPATGTAKIDRGGGWHGHLEVDARATTRSSDAPTLHSNSIGFRCAR
jgi:formylglycine-generating enzyme required for sulfatase activity